MENEIDLKIFKQIKDALNFKLIYSTPSDALSYDEYIDSDLAGRLFKNFYLYKTPELLKKIKTFLNKDNSYITYLNDLKGEKLFPQAVSVLRKTIIVKNYNKQKMPLHSAIYKEVIASRLLNFYGCNTPLNFSVKEGNFNNYILSVDFISKNEVFFSFDNLKASFNTIHPNIRTDFQEIEKALKNKGILQKYPYEELEKIKKQYVYSFLVRKFVFHDSDAFHTNHGIILNEKSSTLQLINFDLEFTFDRFYNYHPETYKSNLEFCKNNYPDIYNLFVEKTKILHESIKILKQEKKIDFVCSRHEDLICVLEDNLIQLMGYISPSKTQQKDFEK